METPKPHPHADLIKAWADGAIIQSRCEFGGWVDEVNSNPTWDPSVEYRIKPEANEPWKPKKDDWYHVVGMKGCVVKIRWTNNEQDNELYEAHNCFRTREEAEAASERVKAALKGTTDVSDNVGSNVGSELDDKPLTDGEKALIRALRGVKICRIPEYLTSVLCFVGDAGKHVLSSTGSITFLTGSDIPADKAVVAALKQIKAEQEASND